MYRKEFFILSAVTLGLFLLVATASLMAQRTLQRDAQLLAADTLPGLVNAGEAMAHINDNWQNIQSLPDLPTAAARAKMMAQILVNNTDGIWRDYQNAILDPQDKRLFEETQARRQRYRELDRQYFDLLDRQRLDEARLFLGAQLEPAYLAYKQAATGLFHRHAEIGTQRAGHIIRLTRWLPWIAGLFCAVIFSFGILVGLKGAFGSLVFASQWRERPKKN